MRKFLRIDYYTLTGIRQLIDLGDFTYGEWIVYENSTAKYHVQTCEKNESDKIVNSLLVDKQETIYSIIEKINQRHGTNLSLKGRPYIGLRKSKELVELNLGPLPVNWLKNL